MKRTVSFTSAGMAMGSFPAKTKVPDPTINTVCYFKAGHCPTVEQLANQVVQPLLKYERLSQVFDEKTHTFVPCRQDYTALDLVRRVEIDDKEQDLDATIFQHVGDTLKDNDGRRGGLPWWEILVVKNKTGGRSACILRMHHALADGLALVHAFDKILTTIDGKPLPMLPFGKSRNGALALKTKQQSFWSKLWSMVKATIQVLTLGSSRFDDDTVFSKCNQANMVYNGHRGFILFPTVPLDFVKAIKCAAGVSVNDVLMTAVSQAIYDFCVHQNDPLFVNGDGDETTNSSTPTTTTVTATATTTTTTTRKIQCRALMPVGFPRCADELSNPTTALRNQWSMASCDLAVGCTNVVERLHQVHVHTTALKTAPVAYMQLLIQNYIAKWLPTWLGRQAVLDVFCRHSLVLTNVPGPSQPCCLAGHAVEAVQLFFENILTQVSVLSYAGQITGNMVYDTAAMPTGIADGSFAASYVRALVHLAQHYQVAVPAELTIVTKQA